VVISGQDTLFDTNCVFDHYDPSSFSPHAPFCGKVDHVKKRDSEETHRYFRPVLSFSSFDPFNSQINQRLLKQVI
jgi:hypothetical protein